MAQSRVLRFKRVVIGADKVHKVIHRPQEFDGTLAILDLEHITLDVDRW